MLPPAARGLSLDANSFVCGSVYKELNVRRPTGASVGCWLVPVSTGLCSAHRKPPKRAPKGWMPIIAMSVARSERGVNGTGAGHFPQGHRPYTLKAHPESKLSV
jgi:hypothetical protein